MGIKLKERPEGSGIWWVFIDYKGRRKAKKIGKKESAEKVRTRIQARIDLGGDFFPEEKPPAPPPPSLPTIEDYFKQYESGHMSSLSLSTQKDTGDHFRIHVLPELGKLRLDEISRTRVKQWVGELVNKKWVRTKKVKHGKEIVEERTENSYSKDSIRLIVSSLRSLFNIAIEDGIIKNNPAARLGKLYSNIGKLHEEVEPLTREEVPLFLGAVKELYPEQYPLFLCAIHTGLRAGELAGLQWGDIDFNGKFLMVRRGYKDGKVKPTKNKKIRRVDISDDLLAEFSFLNRRRKEQWLQKGKQVPDWVFSNEKGNAPDMKNVSNRYFFNSLTKAKIRKIRFHDLRHTFASLLIQNNESLAYVKEQLGHSSIKMTVDVYGHLVPGANRQAVNRLPSLAVSNEFPSGKAAIMTQP